MFWSGLTADTRILSERFVAQDVKKNVEMQAVTVFLLAKLFRRVFKPFSIIVLRGISPWYGKGLETLSLEQF